MNREQEFRQLITSELPMLRRGIYRIVGNAADTDDVIQDAMLKAFLRFDSFKCKSALSTWVYRIAVNCAFDWMRRQKRQADALREYGEMMQAGASSPSDEGRFEALTQAIEKLPDNYREAIVWGCLSD